MNHDLNVSQNIFVLLGLLFLWGISNYIALQIHVVYVESKNEETK